ncbi:hypothetical protein [Joostella sp. CR20]|uniref:hypothetical protein n=1 Tax=Joostella sp. CR20 TaxID=2804312 RepID=UPI00313C5D1F
MTALKNTKENKIFTEILKTINETDWVGNTTFENIEPCLTAINLECGRNSGWYKPSVIRLKGIPGMFLVNEDGSLLYDYRIIKTEKGYLKETLSMSAYNELEKKYCKLC